MGFYASFNKFNDMAGAFDGTIDSFSDTEPFPDESDTDRTGLDTDIDNMEDAEPLDMDDEATETFEDLDDEDVEVGEDLVEDRINEPDLDFTPDQIEPDWAPDDDISPADEATGTSHEDETADTQLDDEPYDEWSETSPWEEILQDDDVIEDDDISQLEETGYDEPLLYPDEDDYDQDPTDAAWEDIAYVDHRDDLTDNIEDEIGIEGQSMTGAASWVDELEDFLDFTEQDTSSFHETDDGLLEGISEGDYYDPPNPTFMADDMLELGNLVDDVFADVFPDPIGDPFAWFDSFS